MENLNPKRAKRCNQRREILYFKLGHLGAGILTTSNPAFPVRVAILWRWRALLPVAPRAHACAHTRTRAREILMKF